MKAGEYKKAEQAFEKLIETQKTNFVGYYNLACALSQQGKLEKAAEAMSNAIAFGFLHRAQLERDPDLEALRGTAFFEDLMEGWGRVVESRRKADLVKMNKLVHARKMEHRTDEKLRLEIVSAHDPVSTDQAIAELELISKWIGHEVLFGLQESIGMGGGEDSAWIFVGLPEKRGFGKWASEIFGPGAARGRGGSGGSTGGGGGGGGIGGAYEHRQRRLVAQDLGATLRHEFVHVLHWRDMNRLGQNHAAWIQEGLASVVEDYDVHQGQLLPTPSWRTNMVKRLLEVRRLPTIGELASMDLATFTRQKPLARYAQARTVLMWLLDMGKLGEFYTQYTKTYSQDPSGIVALGQVLGMEAKEYEKVYREWIEGLERVPETGSDLVATLGISVENGTGDGVVIQGLSGEARRTTGLRMGTVITGIEGRPTRDLHELIRVLGSYKAGQSVRVQTRRGTIHGEAIVMLKRRD